MRDILQLTTASSKGQVVLPKEIRKRLNITKGTVFVLEAKDSVIMLKKIENPILKKDIEELESAQKGWKELEEGKFRRLSKDAFLKELSEW